MSHPAQRGGMTDSNLVLVLASCGILVAGGVAMLLRDTSPGEYDEGSAGLMSGELESLVDEDPGPEVRRLDAR